MKIVEVIDKKATLNAELDRLEQDAEQSGIKLVIAVRNRRALELEYIERKSGAPGSGAVIMQKLCALADARRMRIHIFASAADPDLMAYYERFGFQIDPRGNDEAMMRRLPR